MTFVQSLWRRVALFAALPAAAVAQVGVPGLPAPDIGRTVGDVARLPQLDRIEVSSMARDLADARVIRLTRFASTNRQAVELDADRNPSVRGVVVATGIDAAGMASAEAGGFRLIERREIEGLDIVFARFAVPEGRSLKSALKSFAKLVGDAEFGADNLYFASASTTPAGERPLAASSSVGTPAIGIIDGGVAAHPSLAGPIEQRGFASRDPVASAHGTAIASLVAGRGSIRGAAPGAPLLVADVYGNGPAGGSATLIAQALGWMAVKRAPVVTISLVGPDNPLLRAAVRAAQGKGVLIVAAVGNDGPAAPPSFPASLPGVLAVTGVDAHERVLPEAGRALHVDFAAPGADMKGAAPGGGIVALRGTSYAAPLVAARLASFYPRPQIDRIEPSVRSLIVEAKDLGRKGADPVYGHGLVCGTCATR